MEGQNWEQKHDCEDILGNQIKTNMKGHQMRMTEKS